MLQASRFDFPQLIKTYKSAQETTRYSPAAISSIEKVPRFANPDESKISTSKSSGSTFQRECTSADSRG
jgi:hypothetical protein